LTAFADNHTRSDLSCWLYPLAFDYTSVKYRLTEHLTSNNLVNPRQSAYSKRQSTETALLYIEDHHVNAIGSRKTSYLCLLDISAAFDDIDHNI